MQNYQENGLLPRICFMSYRQLKTFALPIVSEYNHIADIEIIEASFDQALAIAKDLIQNRQVDVFVSAGSNAEILKAHLPIPVITIEVSGYDLMYALIQAKKINQRVGIIHYDKVIPTLDQLKNILAIDLIQYTYKTPESAQHCIAQLKEQGISVVLGSSLIIDLVKNTEMDAILPYSHNSIRKAFDQALEVARITRLEATRFEQINSLLHTLPEAVIAVNAQEQIIAINNAMLEILSPAGIDIRGRVLTEIQPELSLKKTLQSMEKSQPIALQLLGRDWVCHRTPILDQKRMVGAALTLYDASTIYTADTKLRMFERARQYTARHQFDAILGQSKSIKETIERAKCFANSDLDILILGESGTGKELFAQSIHNASHRSSHPFIAVNCAAFPESLIEGELFGHDDGAFTGSKRGGRLGLIEAAHKGTLFLDEIGDMPLSLQTRLLRVLQEREIIRLGSNSPIPVDIRIIAATHQPLKLLVQHQKFRQDLYYRLNTIQLLLPTLKQRSDDIEPLFFIFLQKHVPLEKYHSQLSDITTKLSPYLKQYSWPGNIRELESMTKRISLWIQDKNKPLSLNELLKELPELRAEAEDDCLLNINLFNAVENRLSDTQVSLSNHPIHFPESIKHETPSISRSERVRQAMYMVNGHQEAAAKLLGISRTTLWRWLKTLD